MVLLPPDMEAIDGHVQEDPMPMYTKCLEDGERLVSRCIAGETLLIPVRTQVADLEGMYVLNEVGTLVWERLDGRTPLPALVDAVCQCYDVLPEEATRDVAAFLEALVTV